MCGKKPKRAQCRPKTVLLAHRIGCAVECKGPRGRDHMVLALVPPKMGALGNGPGEYGGVKWKCASEKSSI